MGGNKVAAMSERIYTMLDALAEIERLRADKRELQARNVELEAMVQAARAEIGRLRADAALDASLIADLLREKKDTAALARHDHDER